MTELQIELIGYSASAFILGSFLVSNNIRLLRIINGIGCVLFVIYGSLIGSWPIMIPNAIIFLIQLYYLFIFKKKA